MLQLMLLISEVTSKMVTNSEAQNLVIFLFHPQIVYVFICDALRVWTYLLS